MTDPQEPGLVPSLSRRRLFQVGTLAAAGMALAACSSTGGDTAGSTTPATGGGTTSGGAATSGSAGATSAASSAATSGAAAGGTGGTLKLAGPSEIGNLDPAAAYGPADIHMQRAFNRALFGYPATTDSTVAITVAPDIATEIPTVANGGISADGKTYTITLRSGVKWHAPGGDRPVVAGDVVRGLKRICNPKLGSPVLSYFTLTIAGLQEFYDGFTKVDPTVAAMKAYMDGHEISGVQAKDDATVVFTLIQPASDFLAILALSSFAAPHPVEYNDYLPDSPEMRQHTISNGPYVITTYVQGQSFKLDRNPAWDPATDPLRKAYVDQIQIQGGQEDAAISQQIKAGTLDMQWGDAVTASSEVPGLLNTKDNRLVIAGAGTILPYLTFNYQTSNNNKALTNLKVRTALNYAVDKAAVVQALGGSALAQATGQILPPEIVGFQETDPFATPGNKGDTEKAKQLLAEAGFPNGLKLKMPYRNDGMYPNIATVIQQDLAKAGVTLEMTPMTRNTFYQQYLQNPDATKNGAWDIAPVGWTPDYLGNAARGFFVPLLDGRTYAKGSPNYGGYNNDELNKLIDKALATIDPDEAAKIWAQADQLASADAAWVPIARTKVATLHGSRVKGFAFVPIWHNGDMTNVAVN
jgi:peptide/nickel transport system substrate-binding protein